MGSGAQGAVFLGRFHGEEVAVKKVRDLKETDIKHLTKAEAPKHHHLQVRSRAGAVVLCPQRTLLRAETYLGSKGSSEVGIKMAQLGRGTSCGSGSLLGWLRPSSLC